MHDDDVSGDGTSTVLDVDGVLVVIVVQDALAIERARLRSLLDAHRAATVVAVMPPSLALESWRAICAHAVPLLGGTGADAVCAAVPVTDAVKRVRGGFVVATVERQNLRWARPPALVKRAIVERALATTGNGPTNLTIQLLPAPPARLVVLPRAASTD